MKYRPKSQCIEAIQLDLSSVPGARLLLEKIGATPGQFDMPIVRGKACWWRQSFPNGPDKEPEFSLIVSTFSGEAEAKHGDWIVRGPDGRFSVCTAETFATTFEPA